MLFTLLASSVFAAEPQVGTVPVTAAAPGNRTIWLVAGTDRHKALEFAGQTLPGVDGATADCQGIVADLVASGNPAEQVVSFCGERFLRADLVVGVKALNGTVRPGDTVVVIMLGHGGKDLANDPEQAYWQPYDGSFPTDAGDTGSGYVDTGFRPGTIEGLVRGVVPTGTVVTFVTDTARGGSATTFNGLDLHGPTAADFTGLTTPTFAFSPGQNSGKAGLIRNILQTCLQPDAPQAADGQVSASEFSDCVANSMSDALVPLSAASPSPSVASQSSPLVWLPPKPIVAQIDEPIRPLPKLGPVRAAQRWGGLGVCLASSIGGFVTYGVASSIEAEVKKRDFQIPPSMEDDVRLHDTLVPTTYALWGFGGLGCASFGSSFVDLKVAPTQNGIAVAVSTSF